MTSEVSIISWSCHWPWPIKTWLPVARGPLVFDWSVLWKSFVCLYEFQSWNQDLLCITRANTFWWKRHTSPFSVSRVASHEVPTFFNPVPNGPGRKRLWCPWAACLLEFDVLQPTCQNCWFTITFAERNQFWNGCLTSTKSPLFKQIALLHSYLSSRHPWGC